MRAVNVAAVILAAGASRRLGRPKQNIVLAGETLLQHAIRVASEAGLTPVVVVTRSSVATSDEGRIATGHNVIAVTNHDPDEGIASSIRCGIECASQHAVCGAVLLACDQPALRAKHLRALVADSSVTTGSAYAGLVGVPAYFPAERFPELTRLSGDKGARSLLKGAHAIPAEELALDIDTEADLKRAQALLER